ncbi:MAG: YdgA family protein [Cocleimonas sp.]|nr:YdgA family protein [Cocleimonas sp.]
MKKLLSSIIVLVALVFILWAAATLYLGSKAEQEFKSYLQKNAQVVGKKLFRAELLTYKKTLIGANATLLVSSDFSVISERIGDFELNAKLYNGPIFFRKSGVKFGSSRWLLSFPDNPNINQKLKEFFPNSLPIGVVRIDFEKKAHYWTKAKTSIAEAVITGDYDLQTDDNRGAIALNNFLYGVVPNAISAERINISYQHQKAITANYKPGTASAQITNLKMNHKNLAKALLIDLKVNSNISYTDDELSGFIKADVSNKQKDDYPFESAKISLLFNGLSSDGFVAYNEANAELENLKQQVGWVLEELGEMPEGQDQIWELQDRIEQATKALPQKLADLSKGSTVKVDITSQYKGEESQLKGQLNLEASESNIDETSSEAWFSLLAGKAKVQLSEALHSALKEKSPLKKPDFTLQLKHKKLLMMQ